MFNLTSKEQVIINTWYGGEMKKGMFSIMNYLNPLRGIASMHCSANTDKEGKSSAIFFGLSGTGKTTLSTDPKRLLIGDDEHGWDDEGVLPVPERPKKIAVCLPSISQLAEQCIEAIPLSGK